MKTRKLGAFLLLCSMTFYAQENNNEQNEICKEFLWECGKPVHGEVCNISFGNCNDDVFITIKPEDENGTKISGFLSARKSIVIKGNSLGTIKIIPLEKHAIDITEENTDIDEFDIWIGLGDDSPSNIGIKDKGDDKDPITPFASKVTVYPNPTESSITISTENIIINRYQLYNSVGLLLTEITNPDLNKSKAISLEEYPKGLYNLIMYTETGEVLTKIISKK
ncbi:T9SS type A sorting domain-containing protein [Tenacibaculum sp. 190524A02b]|uniref:T9SS type A sorting domain-containing protein n=1 Tax=Tenacibaculum vairaonense TaxID=3137860 RepID=UPI0032B0F483